MKFENPHTILDGFASLQRHHQAKEALRHRQLDLIPIPPAGRVLDIGIGPGFYLKHWLTKTAPDVHFDLFDSSQEALAICEKTARDLSQQKRVRTIAGDFFKDLNALTQGSYDVIFLGNTIEYVADPVAFIRDVLLPLLKPNGVLAIRDLDCSFMSCNLADPELNARIVNSRIANNKHNSQKDPQNYQNPFIGKDLESIFRKAGLKVESVYPFMIEIKGPIQGAERAYLEALHKSWYVEDTLGNLSKDDKQRWHDLFDSNHTQNVFDNPQAVYREAEFLVIGRKP